MRTERQLAELEQELRRKVRLCWLFICIVVALHIHDRVIGRRMDTLTTSRVSLVTATNATVAWIGVNASGEGEIVFRLDEFDGSKEETLVRLDGRTLQDLFGGWRSSDARQFETD